MKLISKEELSKLLRLNRKKNKYNVAPKEERTVDGIVFHSKKEAQRYKELKFQQTMGIVSWFIRQPIFDLPGGTSYRADFLVVYPDGSKEFIVIEDAKGMRTKEYIKNKKQVEALYPVVIKEI